VEKFLQQISIIITHNYRSSSKMSSTELTMTASSDRSPLAHLVLFLFAISIAGTLPVRIISPWTCHSSRTLCCRRRTVFAKIYATGSI